MNDCKNIFCVWINEQFVPCTEMNKNIDDYKIHYRYFHKRKGSYLIEIDKCPYCNSILKDADRIEREYKTLRKFQIRNTDKDGCGSFYYVTVPISASLEDIKSLILDTLSYEKEKDDAVCYMFHKSKFSHNRKMKIVELDMRTFNIKRNGQKGYVYLSRVQFKGKNILTGKNFDRRTSYFDMEWV